jgi:hypothetical protein
MWCSTVLVLGMDLYKGRVKIQDHRLIAARQPRDPVPHI